MLLLAVIRKFGSLASYLGVNGPIRLGPTYLILTVVFEPKTAKSRMHVDVRLRDQAHLEELLRLGATVVSEHEGRRVLADPEGNEFCATQPA